MGHRFWATSVALALVCSACDRTPGPAGGTGRPPRADEIPAAIDVAGGQLTTGTAISTNHRAANVAPFRVTTSPITVGSYRQCVDAGACTPPASSAAGCSDSSRPPVERATYATDASNDALPVTCAKPSQSEAYCKWVGGSLPSLEQWTLAARGSDVHRFSWGDDDVTCERHPYGRLDPSLAAPCCDGTCSPADLFAVGRHGGGASPAGMQDVLLTRGELLSIRPDSLVPSCTGTNGGECVVTGMAPAAIDFTVPLPEADVASNEAPVYGFRCVWSKG